MRKRTIVGIIAAFVIAVGLTIFMLQSAELTVLSPAGEVAEKQRNLLVFASLLSLIVILPVFALTFFITWKYRESNHHKKKVSYRPNWADSKKLEIVWWGIPVAIIGVLAVVTWNSSHDLDPYKQLSTDAKPVEVQVIALPWRWLFLYPNEQIATVNELGIPIDRPINFTITADAPMNSFWIPKLGGQVYAMTGMSTKLHLIAEETGTFDGSSANLSGEGFATMRFKVTVTSEATYQDWISSVKADGSYLDEQAYESLAAESTDTDVRHFFAFQPDLYDTVIAKYMDHRSDSSHTEAH